MNYYSKRQDLNKEIQLSDSIMNIVDLRFSTYKKKVTIRNCIINHLLIHSSFFEDGFLIENCIIKEKIQYEMGGHNMSPIVIHDNVFCDLFVFFDCQFESLLSINNNVFKKGSTLFNKTNTFAVNPDIYDNIGKMDVDAID